MCPLPGPRVALKGLQIATRIWFDSCHAINGVERLKILVGSLRQLHTCFYAHACNPETDWTSLYRQYVQNSSIGCCYLLTFHNPCHVTPSTCPPPHSCGGPYR